MALTRIDLTPRVGSELQIDLDTLLSGELANEIRELLVERGVLIVRDMPMTDEQQRELTRTLGTLRLGAVKAEGDEGLQKVTMDKAKNPAYAEFFPGTFFWHMDGHYDEVPPFATLLRPQILAPEGGQTEFANTYAAYDDLPADEKAWLETLSIVHNMTAAIGPAYPEATVEQFALWRSYPSRAHPLVWRHRSGRKSLVLGIAASHVVGMHPADSHALIQRLMSWATQPQYVYHHEWRMNDLLMWDNTGTLHRVLPFDESCGRVLHRFTLEGEEPVVAA